MSKDSCLFFFTANYPFGKFETFIENELSVTSNAFDRIYIFPQKNEGNSRRLPKNTFILKKENEAHIDQYVRLKRILKNFKTVIYILSTEFKSDKKTLIIKNIRYWINRIEKAICDAEYVERIIKKMGNQNNSNFIFYSFWLNSWALTLSILKYRKSIDKFYIRSNGFDIFDERNMGEFLPFRYFVYSQVEKVLVNSLVGVNYIKSKNIFPQKIKLSYFGTQDFGLSKLSPNQFHILTCSSLIPIKRIDLMPRILKLCKINLTWTHIGDGDGLEKLLNDVAELPPNITFIHKSRFQEHSSLMKYLIETGIHLFANLSASEGLPVSIQEAISFGIPVIATDVGGTREVVNSKTGILIEKDFNLNAIAKIIDDFPNSSMNTIEFRKGVRKFWIERFELTSTYSKFIDEIN